MQQEENLNIFHSHVKNKTKHHYRIKLQTQTHSDALKNKTQI